MDEQSGRILGLDFGAKGIGVAVSDEFGWTAQPVGRIQRGSVEEDMISLSNLVKTYGIVKVVVGLPRNMDGSLGSQARLVLAFVDKLRETIHLPVVTWDERLSTIAVTRVLLDADLSRKKRKRHVDKMAAAFILQGYLDGKGRSCAPSHSGGEKDEPG
jgi:putative Holliday junction resolvase